MTEDELKRIEASGRLEDGRSCDDDLLALVAEVRRLHKAEAFKAYVHKRLDEAGVPADPDPSENAKHGCRIEGRLNHLLAARDEARAQVERMRQLGSGQLLRDAHAERDEARATAELHTVALAAAQARCEALREALNAAWAAAIMPDPDGMQWSESGDDKLRENLAAAWNRAKALKDAVLAAPADTSALESMLLKVAIKSIEGRAPLLGTEAIRQVAQEKVDAVLRGETP